jgi:tRNA (cytosine38-C5)-methyltransferase
MLEDMSSPSCTKKRKQSEIVVDQPAQQVMPTSTTTNTNSNLASSLSMPRVDTTTKVPSLTITYIEFYSGVGGWTMALQEAVQRLSTASGNKAFCSFSSSSSSLSSSSTATTATTSTHPIYTLKRLAALDHSDLCNRVFEYNFGPRCLPNAKPPTSIEHLSVSQMEVWAADIWMMSPPCQPHTRQHDNQQNDLSDPRSSSFLHLCHLLETMKLQTLPRLIFLENVVGFETSNSFQQWRNVLKNRGYCIGHFHLTPTQVGLPNDRPRYYCVAIRYVPQPVEHPSEQRIPASSTSTTYSISPLSSNSTSIADKTLSRYMSDGAIQENPTIHHNTSLHIWKAIPELDIVVESTSEELPVEPIASFLDDVSSKCYATGQTNSLQIPTKILQKKSSWCFDIVSPSDSRSACFTHSYGRYIRGTGSILYNVMRDNKDHVVPKLVAPEERQFQVDWIKDLDPTKLRYFSGQELARMFGFSSNFSFPPNMTMKQQWKLMGNSLNVQVASRLVELGLKVGITLD